MKFVTTSNPIFRRAFLQDQITASKKLFSDISLCAIVSNDKDTRELRVVEDEDESMKKVFHSRTSFVDLKCCASYCYVRAIKKRKEGK